MAALSSDVDAIWREMQQSTPQVDVARLLRRSAATSSSTKKEATAKKKVVGCAVKKTSALSEPTPTASVTDSPVTQQAVIQPFNLQRELNRLTDEHSSVRKKAALALETHFLQPSTQATKSSAELGVNQEETEEDSSFSELAKPLFKRFNDPVEKVRDVCIRVVTVFVAKEQDLLRFIPYLMPAIANRINSQYGFDEENQQFTRDQFLHDAFKRGRIFVDEDKVSRIKPEEPSEEIRLLFLDLLSALLENAFKRNASSILHAYMFDVLVILVSGLHDPFHEVNIKSCAILRSISNNMVSVMKHFSVAVVRAAKDLLLHRLARVRIAAIDTIRALVTCPNRDKCKGSGTEAIVDLIGHRDENVIPISAFYTSEIRLNYFAKLDQDANPLVRQAFFDMVSDWITNLPDRYDHESRLMPYLLSAVSDENDNISKSAMQTLAFLGTRYEQEHGEDVLEMKQYGVDGKNPAYNYRKQLPTPFLDQRPSLGTRLYVRGRARRFLNPILRELDNWQSKTRGHAVRLLKSIVVYCEETITVDVHLLIQTLLRVWREPEIAGELKVVAELAGRFAAPDTYMSLILARIRGDAEVVAGGVISPEQTATAMELLGLLMEGSLDKTLLPHIHEILETVSTKHILDFESGEVKRALGKLVQHLASLLERRGREAVSAYFLQNGRLTTMERVYDRLFEVALVVARAQNSSEAVACANETLDALVRLESRKSTTELFDAHFPKSFTRVAAALNELTAVQWTRKCCEQLLLEELLRLTSVETIVVELPAIEQLFEDALMQPSVDAALMVGGEAVEKKAPADSTPDKRRGGQSERKAAYTDLLQALLARVEQRSECGSAASVSPSDALRALQALLLTSQAAAT